jgi:hypothetical protein
MELGKVKSGAAWPTFRFVCGATGAVRCGGGVGDGVCAAAHEAAVNRMMTLRARFMMYLLSNRSRKQREFTLLGEF